MKHENAALVFYRCGPLAKKSNEGNIQRAQSADDKLKAILPITIENTFDIALFEK